MAKSYKLALQDARDELDRANSEAKRINLRVSQLEAVIAQLEALITSSEPAPTPLFDYIREPVEATKSPASEPPPLWKAIVAALNGNKGDFSVPMALKALERTGRRIESPNRLNIIRNTLIHKTEVFGRFGNGHYFVRGFENGSREEGS